MDRFSLCPICFMDGKTVHLETKENQDKFTFLQCSNCNHRFPLEKSSPLISYQNEWSDNSKFLFAILRPELPEHINLDIGLKQLLDDCYYTLLIGRYNASMVMMGVFLEALMKERIRLKTGKDFTEPYAKCIDRLRGIKRSGRGYNQKIERAGDGSYLINPIDIQILDRLREVRNTYTHFDEKKVVDGLIGEAYQIPFKEGTILSDLETAFKEVESGQRIPMLIDVTHPALRSVYKMKEDRERAIRLYNIIYDFTLKFVIKYLGRKDYDEYHRRFPTPFVDLNAKLTS